MTKHSFMLTRESNVTNPPRPWECLTHISAHLSFVLLLHKRIGLSLKRAFTLLALLLAFYFTCYLHSWKLYTRKYQKHLQLLLLTSVILVNQFLSSSWVRYSYLLKGTIIDPLHLWVIKILFWRRCRGAQRFW